MFKKILNYVLMAGVFIRLISPDRYPIYIQMLQNLEFNLFTEMDYYKLIFGYKIRDEIMIDVNIEKKDVLLNDAVLAFLKEHCPNHPELSTGKIMEYVEHTSDNFVALYGDKVVGYLSHLRQNLIYRGEKIRVGWGTTIVLDMTDNDIRKSAGRGLLSAAENNCEYFGVGIVPGIIEPYKRRGHLIREDSSYMYCRLIKPRRALRFLERSMMYAPVISVGNGVYPLRNGTYLSVHELSRGFKHKHGAPIKELLSNRHSFYGERDIDYLNWKLRQPDRDYTVLWHHGIGYIIYRYASHKAKDFNVLKICDIVGSPATKKMLISQMIHRELDRIPFVDAIISLDTMEDADVYKECGIWMKKPYMYLTPQKYKDEKLHLTFFDSDLDNLW